MLAGGNNDDMLSVYYVASLQFRGLYIIGHVHKAERDMNLDWWVFSCGWYIVENTHGLSWKEAVFVKNISR